MPEKSTAASKPAEAVQSQLLDAIAKSQQMIIEAVRVSSFGLISDFAIRISDFSADLDFIRLLWPARLCPQTHSSGLNGFTVAFLTH